MKQNSFASKRFILTILHLAAILFIKVAYAGCNGSYTVTSYSDLVTAMNSINTSPNTCSAASSNTVTITATTISISANLPVLQNGATFVSTASGGTAITGNSNRLFATHGASITLENLAISGAKATGGAGSQGLAGGGGGLGAGGAVYVDYKDTVTLINTTISNCAAQGGAGGENNSSLTYFGGGGGASFTSSPSTSNSNVGGGDLPGNKSSPGSAGGVDSAEGTSGYSGGNPGTNPYGQGGNSFFGSSGGSGGGSGSGATATSESGASGGYFGGGSGAGTLVGGSDNGGGGGGGGNGGGSSTFGGSAGSYGGGGGGYGSGGGGGTYSNGGGGGGGGGLGGGGGGGSGGGGGGWGGGGGGGITTSVVSGAYGYGGCFGGNGGNDAPNYGGGGGGAGLGGGIFVGDNATLVFNDSSSGPFSSNISSNTITGGAAGSADATPGYPETGGSPTTINNDIFLFQNAGITFGGSNVTYNISSSVLNDTKAVSPTSDAGITINGNNINVTINSTGNIYSGPTRVTSGTLNANAANLPSNAAVNVGASGIFNIISISTGATNYTGILTNNGAVNVYYSMTPASTSSNSSTGTISANSGGTINFSNSFTNSGTLNLNSGGTINVTGTLTNNGNFNIANSFTPTGTFVNTSGSLYVIKSGSININISGGNLLYYGKNSSGTVTGNSGTFATNGTIANIPIIEVFNGSTLNVNNAITGITDSTTGFSVDTGATANINTQLGDSTSTGVLKNNGTLNLNPGGSIAIRGNFTNNNIFNIATAFTTGSSFINNGALYVYSAGSISGSLTDGSSLTIGQSSAGGSSGTTTYSLSGTNQISGIPVINVYNGSTFTTGASTQISGVTTGLTIGTASDTTNTVSLSGTYSGPGGAVNNYGSLTINNTFATGSLTNHNTLTLASSGSISNSGSFTNSGIFDVAASCAPSNFTNTGALYFYSGGGISGTFSGGTSLTIGQSSAGGSSGTTTYSLTGNNQISSIPIINIYNGSTFTTGAGTSITGVTTGLTIGTVSDTSNTVTLNGTYSGSGTVNNYGTLSIYNTFSSGSFSNAGNLNIGTSFTPSGTFTNTGSLYVIQSGNVNTNIAGGNLIYYGKNSSGIVSGNSGIFTTGGTIASVPIIEVFTGSTLNVNNAITGITNATTGFSVASGATVNINAALGDVTSTGVLKNNGTLNLNSGGSIGITGTFTNSNIFNIATAFTAGSSFANSGALYVYNSGSIQGSLSSGTSLTIGQSSAGGTSGTANYSLSGTSSIAGIPIINIYNSSTFTTGASTSITGVNTSLTIGTSVDTGNNVTFNGPYSGTGAVSNYGSLTIKNTFTSGTITNQYGASLILGVGAVVSNSIDNVYGATLDITGAGSGAINNSGVLNVYQPLDATGNITNEVSGVINIMNSINISVPGTSLTNYGNIYVTGNQNLNATSFVSSGTQTYTITNTTTWDSLASTTAAIDISNGTINITSSYFSTTPGYSYTWPILTGASITENSDTTINPPTAASPNKWTVNNNTTAGEISVTYMRASNVSPPTGLSGLLNSIENVLQQMSGNITNSGQQALLKAYHSATSESQYLYFLNSLVPNSNSTDITVAMQNATFNKVELRASGKHKKQSSVGIATGDINPNTALWMGGFGNLSKQQPVGFNAGYRTKALGVLFGLEHKTNKDNIYGLAFSISNNNVYELSNPDYITRILGYSVLLYGAENYKHNIFTEWFSTMGTNKNQSRRPFGINGTDLSAEASFRNWQAAARLNVGKYADFCNWLRISQVNMLQYSFIHQPPYSEDNSVAALHVATNINSSILTIGTGLRFAVANDAWLVGTRELRAMVTYDAISPEQFTTANFIVGSSDFIVNNPHVRLALKLGADFGFTMFNKLQLQFSYDYEVRTGFYDHFGELKLKYLF